MHEKHAANVFNDIEHEQEIVSEMSVEVLSAHHILSSVAQKDLEILVEVLDSRKMLNILVSHLMCRRVTIRI